MAVSVSCSVVLSTAPTSPGRLTRLDNDRQVKQEERDKLETSLVSVLAEQQRHLLATVGAIPEADDVLKAQVAAGAVAPPPRVFSMPSPSSPPPASGAHAVGSGVLPDGRRSPYQHPHQSNRATTPVAPAWDGKAKALVDSDVDSDDDLGVPMPHKGRGWAPVART